MMGGWGACSDTFWGVGRGRQKETAKSLRPRRHVPARGCIVWQSAPAGDACSHSLPSALRVLSPGTRSALSAACWPAVCRHPLPASCSCG